MGSRLSTVFAAQLFISEAGLPDFALLKYGRNSDHRALRVWASEKDSSTEGQAGRAWDTVAIYKAVSPRSDPFKLLVSLAEPPREIKGIGQRCVGRCRQNLATGEKHSFTQGACGSW